MTVQKSPESERVCLAVFAKFPEPGKCKTRLIGDLTAQQAARLQESMTRHVLRIAELTGRKSNIDCIVFVAGAKCSEMANLYGDQWSFAEQIGDNLGTRLKNAAQELRSRGYCSCIFIGTDCPTLDAQCLSQAKQMLRTHSVSIAPATDGGYVLLAMRLTPTQPSAALHAVEPRAGFSESNIGLENVVFTGIDWGTDVVLSQTLTRIENGKLTCALLPSHADVDRPADLKIWTAIQNASNQHSAAHANSLSVVIPVYNTEPNLPRAIESAQASGAEVVVVGSGDTLETRRQAAECNVYFVESAPGRARQMNHAAQFVTQSHLCFLHADSRLPDGAAEQITQAFEDPAVFMTAFSLRIDASDWRARVIERTVTARSRLLRLPYGDQALAFRAADFASLGGFSDMPLMEDYAMSKLAAKRGKIRLLPDSVTTSDRRWKQKGYLRTTLLNQAIVLGYKLGVAPERLAKWYRGK